MSQQKTTIITMNVPIEKLKLARWDIRREDDNEEDQEEIESLKQSIKDHGLFNPLSVVMTRDSDKYTISGGRRRFRVLKELGWKQIPINVIVEDATETDIKVIAVNENLQRKELKDIEKGFGILSVYESNEYTGEKAIHGTKLLDNYFSHHPEAKRLEPRNLVPRLQENTKHREKRFKDNFIPDEKFIEVCRSIAKTPKYQYQLLQIIVQLDPDVIVTAQKAGLSTKKKHLLTHSKLRDHPKLQKILVKDIAHLGPKEAEHKVRQEISDLDTGYVKKIGDKYYYGNVERDTIPSSSGRSKKIVDSIPSDFDIVKASYELIRLITGRAISKGEFKYTKQIIDKNKEMMYKIAKSLNNERQLIAIGDSLEIAKYTIEEMLKIVDSELDVLKDKKELSTK